MPGWWRGTSVLTAFCGNAGARSSALRAAAQQIAAAADPLFRELIARTTFALLPARDDGRGGRGSIL